MSNPISAAAAPVAIELLEAVQTFLSDMGTDPAQWVVKLPGALLKLEGAAALAIPALEASEAGAVVNEVNGKINALIAKLKTVS